MFTRIIATIATLAAALSGLASAATVKDCGAGNSLFTIQGLGLTPTNPSPGQDVTLHLEYDVPDGAMIIGGIAKYAITLNFIPFQPSTEPLCQDIPCPLGPGSYTNDTVSAWPSGISGSFTSKMTWADEVGTQLLCVQISGSLAKAAANTSTALVVREQQRPISNYSHYKIPEPVKKRGNLRK
jgi:hypothetical protein